jgi:hypothetical protein
VEHADHFIFFRDKNDMKNNVQHLTEIMNLWNVWPRVIIQAVRYKSGWITRITLITIFVCVIQEYERQQKTHKSRFCLAACGSGVALQKLVDYADHRPLWGGGGGHASTPTMYMLDPEFHYFAFNTFGLGAPSNGFYGTLLANERCQQVL